MNQKQIITIKQQITVRGERPIISSEKVAEAFGRRHDNVLRDIDALECSREFRLANFGESFTDRPNPKNPEKRLVSKTYDLTKKGFLFLVLGWRGGKAAALREAYIEAFEQMEAELARGACRSEETAALRAEVLRLDPRLKALLRYRKMGLSRRELALLLRVGASTVGVLMRRLRDLGFIEEPPRQLSLFVKKEVAP